MWSWLRNPKNLAAVTAVAGGVGFVWTQFSPKEGAVAIHSPININIEAKQTSEQAVISPNSSSVAKPVALTTTPEKVATLVAEPHFPMHRRLANGVPVEILDGFWLSLAGYEGIDDDITAYLLSPMWGSRPLPFKVGSPPFDFTYKGSTYQLKVESLKDERVTISIRR
jgi:hypothetical protein